MHGIATHETALVSEMPIMVENENVNIALEQGKTPLSLWRMTIFIPFPNGKNSVHRDI